MSNDDRERQENELLALESIYGERQFMRSDEGNGGQLSVVINFPVESELKILYPPTKTQDKAQTEERNPENDEKPANEELSIEHLPPITIIFSLPENYPSEVAPCFTLSCKWLNVVHLSKLCKHLDNVWNEQGPGMEVLFEWMQILSQDLFSLTGIASPFQLSMVPLKYLRQNSTESQILNIDPRAIQDIPSIENLVTYLIDYDIKEIQQCFEATYFNCGVCFDEKLGTKCVSFPRCKHVYCTDCMMNYFIIQIIDGSVRALTCPEAKCDTQADPNLVRRLVPSDVFEKYDKFLLQSTLDCMNDITYCPRTSCQSPVLKENDQNMGRCPVCNFVFCVLCKRSYHGVANCSINASELRKLREEYLSGTPEEKALLEKRYGKKKLQQTVEEHYSEAWLETFSKKCPSCATNIQKIDGCNKMNCFKCRANFCWLCGKLLSTADPYDHFNDLKGGCFNKLFEGIDFDELSDSDDEDGWVNLVD